MKYHVNPETGKASACRSTKGKCPFGDPEDHFGSRERAQEFYELKMKALEIPKLSRPGAPKPLLETIHGSHLYGLANATSDRDYYRVIENQTEFTANGKPKQKSNKTKQRIHNGDDVLEISLSSFLIKCDEGVPQALEAMFSRLTPPNPFDEFRRSYMVNTARFATTYRRTILNFARLGIQDVRAKALLTPNAEEISSRREKESLRVKKPRRVERNGLLKYRRHATRLLLNRDVGIEYGRFNPTLTDEEREFVIAAGDLEDMKFATLIVSRLEF